MTAVATQILVFLGYLLGATDPMDGQAVGRLSLMFAGLIVTLFLFYLALSGPTIELLHRMWRSARLPAATKARSATVLVETTPSKP